MSSLSEHERLGLDDVFLSLAKKEGAVEKIQEKSKRLLSHLSQIAKKGLPISLSYVKSKKIMFTKKRKMDDFKLFNHFRPKNRGSK